MEGDGMARNSKTTKVEMCKALKKNIQIMDSAFKATGLEIGKISLKPYAPSEDSDDYDADLFVEMTSNETRIDYKLLKVVFFDEDDEILLLKGEGVKTDFVGYDIVKIDLRFDDSFLKKAVSGKIFLGD